MGKFKCAHCRGEFEREALIERGGELFCCEGCAGVYEILNASGLGEFYERLGKTTLNPALSAKNAAQKSQEDLAAIYQNYVKNENGFNKISLIIDGIHCSACVWLNEKVLFAQKGILEVNINSVNNKALIVWDENEVNLAQIFALIRSIGYEPYPYDAQAQEQRLAGQRREFYARLLVGIFCTMNIMWLAVAQYGGYFTGMRADVRSIINFAEFILATPVLFYAGSVFFRGAWSALKNKTQNMDSLIVTGTLAAYIFSVYAMFSRRGEVYFDSVAMIITFVFIGKYLEVLSKKKAADTLDNLNSLNLNSVSVKNGDEITLKSAQEVRVGELVVVRAGERVLLDGVVVSGTASFDLSSLSGESAPAYLSAKDGENEIKSGSVCVDGTLVYEVGAVFGESVLARIINLLETAAAKKPRIQALADAIAARFSAAITALALATFAFWFWRTGELSAALIVAISVVVISCPCALGLATPVSTLVALGAGFRRGILFKEARIIESLAKCDTAVFDKTGTLTSGRLKVSKFTHAGKFDASALFSLVSGSTHPVSRAVGEYLRANFRDLRLLELSGFENIAARGTQAKFDGKKLAGGNEKFMRELGLYDGEAVRGTCYFFAADGEIAAAFELEESLKDGAKECVAALKNAGMRVAMLTGDNEYAAKRAAEELGVGETAANALPTDKAAYVERLAQQGRNVLMVGDGINDAAALALSSVAVCMGSGAAVSIAKSDVVLMRDDPASLAAAVALARKTYCIVRQNLAFSLVYNAVTIPLAMAGYVAPAVAALSMSLSSVAVVLNALRARSER
nr:heavy metal translocating P-type ATPase metal-binding domain-containing protein [uncultured Campylobacter sp.]